MPEFFSYAQAKIKIYIWQLVLISELDGILLHITRENNAVSFYCTSLTIYQLNNQFQNCIVSITVHTVPPKLKEIIKLKDKYVKWELDPWHNKIVNLEKAANNISTECIHTCLTCGYCKGGNTGSGKSSRKKGCSSGLLYLPS
jgi:hypothetical protein